MRPEERLEQGAVAHGALVARRGEDPERVRRRTESRARVPCAQRHRRGARVEVGPHIEGRRRFELRKKDEAQAGEDHQNSGTEQRTKRFACAEPAVSGRCQWPRLPRHHRQHEPSRLSIVKQVLRDAAPQQSLQQRGGNKKEETRRHEGHLLHTRRLLSRLVTVSAAAVRARTMAPYPAREVLSTSSVSYLGPTATARSRARKTSSETRSTRPHTHGRICNRKLPSSGDATLAQLAAVIDGDGLKQLLVERGHCLDAADNVQAR